VKAFYDHAGVTIHNADCRESLRAMDAESVDCCITSPPYWGLRDYGVEGQIGLEETHLQFVSEMVDVFREVRRVLHAKGTLWLNLGDSYANDGKWGGATSGKHATSLHGRGLIGRTKRTTDLKPKDLCGIPWLVAFALQRDGWWLRSEVIWSKPNPMPESVKDRPTKAHEQIFLLSKSETYDYDAAAISERCTSSESSREPSDMARAFARRREASPRIQDRNVPEKPRGIATLRNKRSVWTVPSEPFPGAHFATFPTALVKPMVLAGCPAGGVVLDPFAGTGTTLLVAKELGRRAIGIELNHDYCAMAVERLRQDTLPLTGGAP
jgi:DNA modification methylase